MTSDTSFTFLIEKNIGLIAQAKVIPLTYYDTTKASFSISVSMKYFTRRKLFIVY